MTNTEHAAENRIAALDGRAFDVVIIGGGISGSSAVQHLAAAGFDVLLVEKNDFASAATSRSSRLLHSGLRYLAPPQSVWDFLKKPGAFFAGIGPARTSAISLGSPRTNLRLDAARLAIVWPLWRAPACSRVRMSTIL